MEFILHLPQEIDKDGALWQIWNSFYQTCQYYQSTQLDGTAMMDESSLLLFAARHQINSICTSLKMYDLNLPKLNKILQVVEQACLPYFILLFERFRYFNLKRGSSESLDDFTIILQKQAEICEFGNLKDSLMSNALCSSLKSESLVQYLSSADGLYSDNINPFYSGAERSHGNVRNTKHSSAQSTSSMTRGTRDSGVEILGQFSDGKLSSEGIEISSGNEFRTHDSDHSIFNTERGRHKISLSVDLGRFTEKLKGKAEKRAKPKGTQKCENLFVENKETGSAVPNLKNRNKHDNVPATCNNETEIGRSTKLKSLLLKAKSAQKNFMMIKQFHCCFCEKAFAGQNCLRKHIVLKHKDCTELSCRICRTAFLDVEEYLEHYKNTHVIKQQKPQSSRKPAVKLKVKKDIRRYHCLLCRKMFHKEGYLRRHIYYSHAKTFLCWNCGESFQSLSDYKQHSEKHVVIGKFVCDLCQKQHHSIFRLVSHLKNHLMPQNRCEICGIIFIRQESLAKHIEKHIDEPAHKCKICGKNFVMEARLQYHMRTHSGEKRFTCELCGKMYAQKINLVHHKRWHTGEQPFECEICGKRTRSSGDLSKHKRKHSDKYSYVCEVCGRGFNYSSALVKHRIGHTGKRSYVCDVCGRTFIYREGLRDHIKASRCPGRSESGYTRTPRATKLLQSGLSNNLSDVESKVITEAHSQRASDTSLKDIQDWHCMLRNNEADGGTSVVLVPSFY